MDRERYLIIIYIVHNIFCKYNTKTELEINIMYFYSTRIIQNSGSLVWRHERGGSS